MNDVVKELLKQPIIRINITKDKTDKDSLYIGDIISAQMDDEEAKENILAFCHQEEALIQKMKDDFPNMLELINAYFGGKIYTYFGDKK